MTLLEVVRRLDQLDRENELLTIYVVEPWRTDSDAVVVEQPDDGNARVTFKTQSGDDACYFLEVFVAREFLEAWRAGGYRSSLLDHPPTSLHEDCERLIDYALFDA